jgi:acetolactate decarboxylase
MKRKILVAIGLGFALSLAGCAQRQYKDNVLFQLSNAHIIRQGDFDGRLTLGKLKHKGDFGIGTFDRLDGEMAESGGVIYQTKSDGKVCQPADTLKTPFAMVTFFKPDKSFVIDRCGSFQELAGLIEKELPDKNRIYALKVEGEFEYLKLRSAAIQSKPYKILDEALEEQGLFERKNIQGELVGYWFPAYMEELNSTGIHFHFISADRLSGGHVLEARSGRLKVDLGYITDFKMSFRKE